MLRTKISTAGVDHSPRHKLQAVGWIYTYQSANKTWSGYNEEGDIMRP
jgi:hypothetical protein